MLFGSDFLAFNDVYHTFKHDLSMFCRKKKLRKSHFYLIQLLKIKKITLFFKNCPKQALRKPARLVEMKDTTKDKQT